MSQFWRNLELQDGDELRIGTSEREKPWVVLVRDGVEHLLLGQSWMVSYGAEYMVSRQDGLVTFMYSPSDDFIDDVFDDEDVAARFPEEERNVFVRMQRPTGEWDAVGMTMTQFQLLQLKRCPKCEATWPGSELWRTVLPSVEDGGCRQCHDRYVIGRE